MHFSGRAVALRRLPRLTIAPNQKKPPLTAQRFLTAPVSQSRRPRAACAHTGSWAMASIGPCVAVQDLHHFCPRQQFGSVDKRLPKPIRSWPPSLIVDVGAHDGSDALSYAVHNHSVLSFEPAHSKAQRIRALLAKDRRGRQVTFYEAAVGAHAGNASFYTTGGETDSLADDAVGAPPAWAKNATRATQKQTVRVVSLDEVVGGGRSVAFLKVDAQGHDAAVLRGAARLLVQRRALVVLFEVRHVHVYTAYCGAWH